MLEDYGDVAWTSCQNMNCPASGKQVCCRCADIDKPVCKYCDDGDSCSMCWLIGPHILKEGYDNYQKYLAKRCEFPDCPLYAPLDDADRCLSCWDRYATGLGLSIEEPHRVWTIQKCGHQVCEANQIVMKCQSDSDCSICKEEEEHRAKIKEQRASQQQIQADVPLMKDLMGRLQSESAKNTLVKWLKQHDQAKDETSNESVVKRQKT